MKKILLTTTAVGLFAAAAAHAEGPTVTLGGYADFQAGYGDQAGLYETQNGNSSIYSRNMHTASDTQLHIKVDGKTDSGLGYGAFISLEADVSAPNSVGGANDNAARTYLYVESGFGRVEAGATGDAADALRVDASTFARATGGIGGDFYRYVDLSDDDAAAAGTDYYILPGLPTAAGILGEASKGRTDDSNLTRATANKISYYSPRIQGAQLGVSYTPDQSERGTSAAFNSGDNQTIKDAWNLGLNYEGKFQDVGLKASATGEWATTEDNGTVATTRDDLEAYALGLAADYAGFTLGGSYGSISEFSNTATNGTEADYWTLGGAYEFGPFATSITYMSSEIEKENGTNDAEFTNLSIGADYQLAPGFVPYVEVSFFETDNNIADTAATTDNDGTVFIIGTSLSF